MGFGFSKNKTSKTDKPGGDDPPPPGAGGAGAVTQKKTGGAALASASHVTPHVPAVIPGVKSKTVLDYLK